MDAVLLPLPKGQKRPLLKGWQKFTVEKMRDLGYLKKLNIGGNIGVLLGSPSGGLCSIDFDDDEQLERFLSLNPKLSESLRSKGKRGGNVWVKVDGEYPASCPIKTIEGNPVGEWRATGNQTVISGVHPEGMSYQITQEAPPTTLPFDAIIWPEDLVLPWKREKAKPGNAADAELRERFGDPVVFGLRKGGRFIKAVNQGYWAGLYPACSIAVATRKH